MADRTNADICGNIIRLLDDFKTTTEVIQQVWSEFMVYDFSLYQTGLPKSLLERHKICSYCGGTSEWPCCEDEDDLISSEEAYAMQD